MGTEQDLEIRIGDWVTCYYAGYWQVADIKHNSGDSRFSDVLVIVKKGFTPNMEFRLSLKFCDIAWCKKISGEELGKIETYFRMHPDKKQEFDAFNGPLAGITKGWVVDATEEEVQMYNEKLRTLPKYFSLRQFNRLAEETGLRRHMFPSSKKADFMLAIVTYPWLTEENKGSLYFMEKGIHRRPQTK